MIRLHSWLYLTNYPYVPAHVTISLGSIKMIFQFSHSISSISAENKRWYHMIRANHFKLDLLDFCLAVNQMLIKCVFSPFDFLIIYLSLWSFVDFFPIWHLLGIYVFLYNYFSIWPKNHLLPFDFYISQKIQRPWNT